MHLGLGAFFRAHGAIYVQEADAAGEWGILGVSLQRPDIRDALAGQQGLYHALELGPDGQTARLVGSITGVLVAPEDPEAVLEAMADPAVRIVSLTVTEKGYCHHPATGRLDRGHPDILHDLGQDLPRSAPGFLTRALQRRRARGLRPFTVLCCDNLPDNGGLVRALVLELAGRIDPALAAWIAAEGRFPATMVDRIVPAATSETRAAVARLTGSDDRGAVQHEPFRQWVVEDDFVDGARPDLGRVGVDLVADVTPYEHMKLRLLNGTHSALAYLGYLAGHETIADCMADPVFAAYAARLWREEIIPVTPPPPGVALADYADRLALRYRNPGIRHRTWQIAMDGSQKLPQRILGTMAENLKAGRGCPGLALAVAGWMVYVGGTDLAGQPIDVRDPLAARLRAAVEGRADVAGRVAALLAFREIFPPDLAAAVHPALVRACSTLHEKGARGALEALT